MVAKKFVSCLIAVLIAPATTLAGEAAYGSLFDDKGTVLEVGEDFVRLADVEFPATHCPETEKYACVISKVFVFSIPRVDEAQKKWAHGGATYSVLSRGDMIVMGERIVYTRIRQQWNGNVVDYVYSSDRGVVSIKARNGNQIMLNGKCGFAAVSDSVGCKEGK